MGIREHSEDAAGFARGMAAGILDSADLSAGIRAVMEATGRAMQVRMAEENERLRRENRDILFIVAILLRRLGGEAFVSEAEQIREDATIIRVPAKDGYRLLLREPVRPALEIVRQDVSETGSGATDKGVRAP